MTDTLLSSTQSDVLALPHVTTNVVLAKKNKSLDELKKKLKSTKQREKRAKIKATSDANEALQRAKLQAGTDAKEIARLSNRVNILEEKVSQISYNLLCATKEIETQQKRASALKYRWMSANRTRDALRKKIKRIQSQKPAQANTQVQEYYLKDSGIIRPVVRDMLRKLACKGIATERICDVINIVSEGLGVGVIGAISARSVGRVMYEGLVQATMQIAHELQQAESVSLCGDGTTIKNQQHESKSLYLQTLVQDDNASTDELVLGAGRTLVHRTLGVHKAVSHTAQQQLTGWLNALDNCCLTLNKSPLGQSSNIASRMVAPKLRGILTDHAADQKRLVELMVEWKRKCDREARAVSILGTMTTEQQLNLLSGYLDEATNSVGDWKSLPFEKQSAMMHDAWFALAFKIGETEYRKLSHDAQFDTDFVAWAGCCMHKELNALKGGVAQMSKAWKLLGLTPPMELKNKLEVELNSQVIGTTSRGAIKLLRLTGGLYHNRDDKKGYQKIVDNYFWKKYGSSKRYPDVSNTRYGSYCDAAIELVMHKEDYLYLMERVRLGKIKPTFVNIERNVCEGLQDVPTLTELVVLVLYAQAIGRPYMRYVRGGSMRSALDLGPFHSQVKQHCQAIAQNPDLLIGPDTSYKTAVLGGQPWDRPDVINCALDMAKTLPHLREILVAFFEGALETWDRFTSEFGESAEITRATPEQRLSAWVPATNDVSEGALGRRRQMLRRAPNMTDNQCNARVMWQDNHTHDWVKATLADADERWIRKEARQMDSSGAERKLQDAMDSALEDRAAAGRDRESKALTRRSNKEMKLASVKLLEDATYEKLASMRVKELDEQIDKLREVGGAPHIRPKSMIGNKEAKIKELLAALEAYSQIKDTLVNNDCSQSDQMLTEGESNEMFSYDDCPEDLELCYDDEVIF